MSEENKLELIVKESGLEATKAQTMLKEFQDYFEIAAEWEARAKAIVVTSADQTVDMKIAREGRLFLREKRIAIEKTRKALKEQALREGKAIDGIANVLKALIVPLEEYLGQQEHFVEIQAAQKAEEERILAEQKAEKERLAAEKAEREEQERIRKENIRLHKEAEKKEAALVIERAAAEKERQELERKAEAAARKAAEEKQAIEEEARKEREKQAAKLAKEKKARKEAEARAATKQITCPHCGITFSIEEGL